MSSSSSLTPAPDVDGDAWRDGVACPEDDRTSPVQNESADFIRHPNHTSDQVTTSAAAVIDYAPEPESRWSLWGVLGSRGTWALADQATVSLGNFITSLVLANAVAPAEYGVFVLLFGVVMILNSLHGSVIVYPLSL